MEHLDGIDATKRPNGESHGEFGHSEPIHGKPIQRYFTQRSKSKQLKLLSNMYKIWSEILNECKYV